jgi:hypothetical protein
MYLGTDYTATASGSVVKIVCCEACDHEYAYGMSRRISSSTFSVLGLDGNDAAASSQQDARQRLRRALKKGCDPVPCPQCGWYQKAMILRLRKIRLRWVTNLVLALILSPIFITPIAALIFLREIFFVLTADFVMWGSVPLLLLGRYLLNKSYDPNRASVESRIALGRKLAFSEEEYFRYVEEEGKHRRRNRDGRPKRSHGPPIE